MAEENALDTPAAKRLAFLIDFTVGGTVYRRTNWSVDVFDGAVYYAEPSMVVQLPTMDGAATSLPAEIELPRVAPWTMYGVGRAAYPVTVQIDELDPDDLATRRTIYTGKVGLVESRLRGDDRRVSLQVADAKRAVGDGKSNARLGRRCLSRCDFPFGGYGCDLDLTDKTFSATVDTQSGLTIACSYPGTVPATDAWRWVNGVARLNGLEIRIRQGDGVTFRLNREPPADWLNNTIELVYGCDKEPTTCVLWGNEARFAGIGRNMPDHNPMAEEPP